jgi:glutathione synthase/RimK-type ligase-like ATP-grasp enzyme
MILFVGIPSEPPMAMAIEAARRGRHRATVLNQRQSHLADIALDVGGDGEGLVCVQGRTRSLSEVRSVYVRTTEPRHLPEHQARGRRPPDPAALERADVFHDLLNQWLETTAAVVVNRPGAMATNMSKPYQAQFALRVGLHVPPTLVTNDVAALEEFRATHGRLVYKSISSVRSIVQELTPERATRLDLLRHLPTQFQAFVDGVNVRVHVVGHDVFATEIETEAVDYRYAARDGISITMRPFSLPADVADACRRLSADLRLPFTGIDLKRSSDGRWYCFEANPSPAYSYYEADTGQPIADALVRYLSSHP